MALKTVTFSQISIFSSDIFVAVAFVADWASYLLTIFAVISVKSHRLVWKNRLILQSPPLYSMAIHNSSANIFLQCTGIEGNRGILALSAFNYYSPRVCHSLLFTGDALWFFSDWTWINLYKENVGDAPNFSFISLSCLFFSLSFQSLISWNFNEWYPDEFIHILPFQTFF